MCVCVSPGYMVGSGPTSPGKTFIMADYSQLELRILAPRPWQSSRGNPPVAPLTFPANRWGLMVINLWFIVVIDSIISQICTIVYQWRYCTICLAIFRWYIP